MKTAKKPKTSSKTQKTAKSPKVAKPTRAVSAASAKYVASGLKPKHETRVEIKPAKGRPMLTWVGKKPLRHATAYPAQLVESFNAQSSIKNRKSEMNCP